MLVTDNAGDTDQAAPSLPATSGRAHRVLVTSRDALTTLPEARHVDLDVLSDDHAVDLLETAVDWHRPGDQCLIEDSDGALRWARLCAGLSRVPKWLAEQVGCETAES